ncbi:hypothetical protein PGT21_015924 [Puccinia graminis f. sp. tritici]|uniref:Uncharacterized protein n=1 Tax=Puccinia graminis f. sp. tritici TaxID=56615 RepID=A0A5B0MNX5_PUCGR|nr:hypothetical protein PGT21_015924 [Puccinia graminis f. sp. tritici]KAA1102720.1 hypothetical protein PGTUg99_034235 [Puccinia graminis f. sp. tritici]
MNTGELGAVPSARPLRPQKYRHNDAARHGDVVGDALVIQDLTRYIPGAAG